MDEPKATSMVGFVYLQTKARHFMRVGPDIYRKTDFFHLPDASLSTEELDLISSGMEQIAEGRGESRETPLTGLDISGFYQLARTLHLEIVSHLATRLPEGGGFIDDMICRHVVVGGKIILYNLVLYNLITDWGCNSPD